MLATFVDATACGKAAVEQLHRLAQTLDLLGGKGTGQVQGMFLDRVGGLTPTVIGLTPAGEQTQPVLNQLPEQFGIDFTQDAPRLGAFGLIQLSVRFPQFEEQFNLPARARQHERFRQTEPFGRDIGHVHRPIGQAQALQADGLPAPLGLGIQALPPSVSDGLSDSPGQQACRQAMLRAELNGQLHLRRGLRLQIAGEVQRLTVPVVATRAGLWTRQPIGALLVEARQHLQIEIAQVCQA